MGDAEVAVVVTVVAVDGEEDLSDDRDWRLRGWV